MKKHRRVLLVLAHLSILTLLPAYSSPNTGLEAFPAAMVAERRPLALESDPRLLPPLPGAEAERKLALEAAAAKERGRRLSRRPHAELIRKFSDRHGLDGLLVAAIIEAESGFDPRVISERGAVGLMQLMPTTVGRSPEELMEPALNVELGTAYFRDLLDSFGGDLELALAAYNAGPGHVRRHGGLPPFRETRDFVDRVLDDYRRDLHVATP